ncbi:hypothetical protein F4823DRAFT_636107 [Ustulina deusta]|nr:hypothetical protein F4823DRAFT_636107 [Ustulina deusta]
MGTLSHVLHTGARPISVHEFAEALRAVAPPRFPAARQNIRRSVGVAVSGGVDSMALVYLCTRLKMSDPGFKIADNPVSNFRATVVDHQLREGSKEEAGAVRSAVRRIGMSCDICRISWPTTGALGQYKHPKDLPNFESVARVFRYRKLGRVCSSRRSASLLVAHHEDDQYETVLMRLLQGHGVRGLRGMKAASDIPECEGLHGAHQSGYVDDQREARPFYNTVLSRRQYRRLRRELRSSIDRQMNDRELREPIIDRLDDFEELYPMMDDFEELYQTNRVATLDLASIDVEDGGVMVYRPLLGFSKDRLIATCEANKIPWWEDRTNQDPTLTMRNAVRHMYKNYTLPVALQKPSILALSRRCEQDARALEAEANRLLAQTIIHDVEPNVGTASVQFPEYSLSRFPRDMSSPSRRGARIRRQREVAGFLIRRIIALVTPEAQTIPLAGLQNVISRLFPALSNSPDGRSIAEPPKAFVIAGVHFVPIHPSSPSDKGVPSQRAAKSLAWYLSRTPYPSDQPIPRYRAPYWSMRANFGGFSEANSKWSAWMRWGLWDGRFWIHIRHRLPYRVILQPFERSHAKAFRESLPPKDRDHLAALLKRYAPGKTRYTLPALYLEEDLDLDNMKPRRYYPLSPAHVWKYYDSEATADSTSDHPSTPDVSKMKLIALPSLNIQIPHLERWLEFEIRYRRIDRATLETAGSFHRTPFVPSRSLRTVPAAATTLTLRRAFRQRKGRLRRGRRILDRGKRDR